MTKVVKNSTKPSGSGVKKGYRRGGRAKGTPNKRTQSVIDKLAKLDFDPLESLARLAIDAKKEGDKQMEFHASKELAQYVAPKRKAMEMTAEVTNVDLADGLTETQRKNLKKLL